MAKTLLNGVNEVLKRVQIIQGDTGVLTDLTESSLQVYIDVAVQAWNEEIVQLYAISELPLPKAQAEATITLATNDKDYALNAAVLQLIWPLVDKTNSRYIHEWKHGYNDLIQRYDPQQDDTGTPHWGAISPVNDELVLDVIPSSDVVGNVYTYQYFKELVLTAAADNMPFKDEVFRQMVPVVAQRWRRNMERDFDELEYKRGLGTSGAILRGTPPRNHYNPRAA